MGDDTATVPDADDGAPVWLAEIMEAPLDNMKAELAVSQSADQ